MQPEVPPAIPDVVDRASRAIAAEVASRLQSDCVAVVLSGGAARGEISVDHEGRILSDLDLLVVVPERSRLKAVLAVRRYSRRLQGMEEMGERFGFGHVSIAVAPAARRYWSMATPMMWELRRAGRVVAGSHRVLDWPALTSADQIPTWEGIRLLANRACELADAIGCHADGGLHQLRYPGVKLSLACSEAALIAAGLYAPSYLQRQYSHARVAPLFSASQNALIGEAYRFKLATPVPRRGEDVQQLVGQVARLGLATFCHFGVESPASLARRTRAERPAAPHPADDLLFFAHSALRGRPVPPRRAIATVYAEAHAVLQDLAIRPDLISDAAFQRSCRKLAARYRLLPQVVSVRPAPSARNQP